MQHLHNKTVNAPNYSLEDLFYLLETQEEENKVEDITSH